MHLSVKEHQPMRYCSNNQKMHYLPISKQDPSCAFLCFSYSFPQPNPFESNSSQGREMIRRVGRERKSARKNYLLSPLESSGAAGLCVSIISLKPEKCMLLLSPPQSSVQMAGLDSMLQSHNTKEHAARAAEMQRRQS